VIIPHDFSFVQRIGGKAHFRGSKYVNETLKLLPQKPDQILIQQIFNRITKIRSINGG
jgi:putative transposase